MSSSLQRAAAAAALASSSTRPRPAPSSGRGEFEACFGGLDFSEFGEDKTGASPNNRGKDGAPAAIMSNAAALLQLKQREAKEKQENLREEQLLEQALQKRVEMELGRRRGDVTRKGARRSSGGLKSMNNPFSAVLDMHGGDSNVLEARNRKSSAKKRQHVKTKASTASLCSKFNGGANQKARPVKKFNRKKF